jgi:hypothetical protein
MLFLAELPWCLVFVQKSNFQEKSRKILQKSYFTRRHTEPEYETEGATRGPHHLVARARLGRARGWCGRPRRCLDPSFRLHIPSDLNGSGVRCFSQIEFRYVATTRNRNSKPKTPFWHPAGTGIRRRSSSSSPTSLRQPSMTPPSICE